MKGTRHGSATVEFPSDREILVTRKFDAPIELVFDALTNPEHVRVWFGAKELEVCEIDLRVGGNYHFVGYVMDGDTVTCSFRGTYLEIERPARLRQTWVFDGRPEADAMETMELREEDGVTTMTDRLAFKDQATRDSFTWTQADGVHADEGGQVGLDRLEDYLPTLGSYS
ncbi:MAG TPA: SRPBCC domain-containing protein [Trebonia sp.]|nr:SRPBCC domain-containing protein [Trebonia sp.]